MKKLIDDLHEAVQRLCEAERAVGADTGDYGWTATTRRLCVASQSYQDAIKAVEIELMKGASL